MWGLFNVNQWRLGLERTSRRCWRSTEIFLKQTKSANPNTRGWEGLLIEFMPIQRLTPLMENGWITHDCHDLHFLGGIHTHVPWPSLENIPVLKIEFIKGAVIFTLSSWHNYVNYQSTSLGSLKEQIPFLEHWSLISNKLFWNGWLGKN